MGRPSTSSSSSPSSSRSNNGVVHKILLASIAVATLYHVIFPSPTLIERSTTIQKGHSDSEKTTTNSLRPSSIDTSKSTHNVDMSFDLARHESLGYFDDIPAFMWHRYKEKQSRNPNVDQYRDPDSKLWGENPFMWYFNDLEPTFTCPHVERVSGYAGNKGDGPKWVCDPHRLVKPNHPDAKQRECLIYSIGSAGKYRFEVGIQNMHDNACEIHVFDPGHYERKNFGENRNIYYHAWGIKSSYEDDIEANIPESDKEGAVFLTIQETIEKLGHQGRYFDIFKMDCESCEWSTIKDWIDLDIGQILLEVHGVPSPTAGNKWYNKPMVVSEYFNQIFDRNFALFSKEWNNNNCVELSFIKLHSDFWGDSEAILAQS